MGSAKAPVNNSSDSSGEKHIKVIEKDSKDVICDLTIGKKKDEVKDLYQKMPLPPKAFPSKGKHLEGAPEKRIGIPENEIRSQYKGELVRRIVDSNAPVAAQGYPSTSKTPAYTKEGLVTVTIIKGNENTGNENTQRKIPEFTIDTKKAVINIGKSPKQENILREVVESNKIGRIEKEKPIPKMVDIIRNRDIITNPIFRGPVLGGIGVILGKNPPFGKPSFPGRDSNQGVSIGVGLTKGYEKWFGNSKKGYTAQEIKPKDDKNNKPEEVKEVETMLKELGYINKVDEKYDKKSQEAVRKIQKENGLKQTGIVDKKTLKAIKDAYKKKIEDDKRIVDIVPSDPKPPTLPIQSTINIGMGGRINGTLRFGDQGNDVKDLETKLAYLNYNVGDKGDKLYDANTRIAVIKFKENNGFKESTGLADKDTIDKINEVYNNALSANKTPGWDNLGQGFCNDKQKVLKLEVMLNDLGYLPGEIDSRYTSTTKGAVLRFQKEEMHMANPNGIVDKATMDKINEIHIEKKGTGNTVTVKQLENFGWINSTQQLADKINEAMSMFGINKGEYAKEQIIAFMAITGHESGMGGYGYIQSGASDKYRGAGAIQLTGKENYDKFDKYLKAHLKGYNGEIMKSPDPYKVVAKKYAWMTAGWYWTEERPIKEKLDGYLDNGYKLYDGFITSSAQVQGFRGNNVDYQNIAAGKYKPFKFSSAYNGTYKGTSTYDVIDIKVTNGGTVVSSNNWEDRTDTYNDACNAFGGTGYVYVK